MIRADPPFPLPPFGDWVSVGVGKARVPLTMREVIEWISWIDGAHISILVPIGN